MVYFRSFFPLDESEFTMTQDLQESDLQTKHKKALRGLLRPTIRGEVQPKHYIEKYIQILI